MFKSKAYPAYFGVMDNVGKLFAMRLKAVRIQKGMTQADLAKVAKLSVHGVQSLEIGRAWPEHDTVMRIAKALGVNESFLFFDPENIPPEEVAKLAVERLGIALEQPPKRVAHPRKKKS